MSKRSKLRVYCTFSQMLIWNINFLTLYKYLVPKLIALTKLSFPSRLFPATVTQSFVRLTPATPVSVSLPSSTCPTTRCSSSCQTSTWSYPLFWPRPARSRTPGPMWMPIPVSCSSTTAWTRWTTIPFSLESAELWVSFTFFGSSSECRHESAENVNREHRIGKKGLKRFLIPNLALPNVVTAAIFHSKGV